MDNEEYRKLFEGQHSPELVNLNPTKYIVADRKVLAESSEALLAVKALYMLDELMRSRATEQQGHYDYGTYPLEGVWSLINKEEGFGDHHNITGNFMLMQPDFLTEEFFATCKNELLKEKHDDDSVEHLKEINLRVIDEGLSVKMLHVGPYAAEQPSFDAMEQFAAGNNLRRTHDSHRESYIKDIRTVTPEMFETILTFPVARRR